LDSPLPTSHAICEEKEVPVFAKLSIWLDHRTGCNALVKALLIEHIPGGARWRYVWGSCLVFVFSLQLITGLLLMTAYSPGDSTAWSSVYFIQYQMDFGWLIRGLHHFGSQAMVVLLGIHMLQVVIAGAHLPPREVNWWLGLGLLGTVLALSLTGYLLPWDQKGYWATQVATNIAGNQPIIGPWLQKIIVGGPVYGHHTLTRFFTLHVGVLPFLVIVFTIAHLTVFRRHGVTTPRNCQGEGWFWPEQAFRDMVVSMVIFAILLGLVLWGHGQKVDRTEAMGSGKTASDEELGWYQRLAHAGQDGKGANLDAPADPARPYPARPEWYFLFLFQLLKYFEGEQEIIGTVVIPVAAGLLLALLPLLGYGRLRKFGHVFGVLVIVGLLGGAATLTGLAIARDHSNSEDAKLFQQELSSADQFAHRAIQLAQDGIPAEGAILLLRRDPLTQGPKLFQANCAACHNYGETFHGNKATASDLAHYGSKEWIDGLLKQPESPSYLGHTSLKTMIGWVNRTRKTAARQKKEAELDAELGQITAWLADPQKEEHKTGPGFAAFKERCNSCHGYQGEGGEGTRGPDFTGYGSTDWVRLMIMAPNHEFRYGLHNRMPAFRDLEGPASVVTRAELQQRKETLLKTAADGETNATNQEVEEACKIIQLSDTDRELIIRWLLGDDRVVFGGDPITASPRR
jgi:ubiquinol-cytochrome c reductase cytochrome b subunit